MDTLDELLLSAVSQRDVKAARRLLRAGADPHVRSDDGSHSPVLVLATRNSDEPMARALLDAGVHVDLRDKYSKSALHYAIENEDLTCLDLLLNHKAAQMTLDDGITPLMLASMKCSNEKITERLLAAGAEVNNETHDEYDALYFAIRENKSEVARALINAGSDLAKCYVNKNTPLHTAILYGCDDIAMMLLESGADIYALTSVGATPGDYAGEYKRDRVLATILEMGYPEDRVRVRVVGGTSPMVLIEEYDLRLSKSVVERKKLRERVLSDSKTSESLGL